MNATLKRRDRIRRELAVMDAMCRDGSLLSSECAAAPQTEIEFRPDVGFGETVREVPPAAPIESGHTEPGTTPVPATAGG